MELNTGSQSSGTLSRVFSFATAIIIFAASTPRQGCLRATISYRI